MADLLALNWDRNRLTGTEVTASAAGPRILNAFSVEWPEQPPTSSWLRDTLRRAGVNARQVVLALPREDAVLRLLELPSVSDDELPTLVRFQAAARSAQPLDQLLLDYLPLPMRTGVAQKEVWLATALLTTTDPIRALLVESGLELSQLTLSSMCLTELVARGETIQSMDPAGASLVVLRDGARMELAVVCQRQLIAAHAVKWSSASDVPPVSKMLAEVSRVLVQVQAWLPEGTLQRVWVIGDDADIEGLPEALGQRWKCPVQRFDPWRDAGISQGSTKPQGLSSHYAIVAGLALIQSGAKTPKLDLLHPRQPPAKRDRRKPIYAAAAAAGLLVSALGTGIVVQGLNSYDKAIDEARIRESSLKQSLKAGEPVFVAATELDRWKARDIDQLQQMAELHQVMVGTGRLIIADYKFEPTVTPDVLARIIGFGYARDRVDAQQLYQHLADLPKFRNGIRPKPITDKTPDQDYSHRYEIEIDIASVSDKSPTSTKSTKAVSGTK